MSKFKEKLYRFAYGRNGVDQLYYFGLVLTFLFMIADFVLQLALPESLTKTVIGLCLSTASTVTFVWILFRAMSRNLVKRRRENANFLKMWRALKRFFSGNTSRGTKSFNRDDATYIFRDCTRCGSTLRLQRKKGKNRVKCPRCSHSFYVKAKEYKYK
jgi:DNA-directed RNA polymerase subunit RPC12/RpoP